MSTPTPPPPPSIENLQPVPSSDPVASKPELKEIAELLKDVPEADRGRVISTLLEAYAVGPASMAKMTHFSGPFPHPEILRGMNDIVPGSAAQIIQMAVDQSDHRREIEKKVVRSQLRESTTGQWMGYSLAIIGFAIGGFLIYRGHDVAGGVMVTADFVSLISVFVLGRRSQNKEMQDKKSS